MSIRIFASSTALVVLALASADQAHGANRDRFTHRPTGYDIETRSNGREMCLEGSNPRTGGTFNLHLSASGRVTGTFEGRNVDFQTERRLPN